MSISTFDKLTEAAKRIFLAPKNTLHRQYEALRAFFVDGLPSAEAARRFGYTPGSFRVLCHDFRQNPDREFFLPSRSKPQQAPKKDPRQRGDHGPAQAEPVDLRHQPHPGREGTQTQPGGRRPDPEGGGVRPAPETARR